jgi:hypothetical protein
MSKKVRLGALEMPAIRNRFCFMALAEAYTYYLHLFPNGSHIWIKKWWDFDELDVSVNDYRLISVGYDYQVKKAQRSLACICVLMNSSSRTAAINRMERVLNIISLNNNTGFRLMEETLEYLPAPKGFSDVEIEFDEGKVRIFKSGKTSVERFNPFILTIQKKGEIYPQYEIVPDLKGPFELKAVVIKTADFASEIRDKLKTYEKLGDKQAIARIDLAMNIYRNTLIVNDLRVAFINYWTALEIMLDKREERGLLDEDDLRNTRTVLCQKYEAQIDRIMCQVRNIDKRSKIDRMISKIGRYLDNPKDLKAKLRKFNRLRGKLVHLGTDANELSLSANLVEIKALTESLLKNAVSRISQP